ncbi:MAG: DUF6531 domain-containing protein, partial [Sulfuricaulis sp.]|nr:DUF6531 domain-containing protein [Sulfuricaulis sp.]
MSSWQNCYDGGGWFSCQDGAKCENEGETFNFETQQCQPEKDSDDKCDTSVSNPCNAATGNKHQEEKDYHASAGLPSLTRYYNSLLRRHFAFGTNWTSTFQRSLEIQGNNASNHLIQIRQESGRGEPFRCTNYICSGDADTALTLTQDTTGYTLTLRGGGGATERYDTTSKLLSETSPTGQATAYGYDTNGRLTTVSSAFGHILTFGYNTSGHVATVTDPTGQVISYSYDTNNLTRVDCPDATAKLYHYENTSFPNHLTGISHVDAGGVTTRYSTYAYDTNGKATLTQHAQTDNGSPQERFTLNYDSATQTTVTDPIGMNEVMTFTTNLGVKNLVTKTSSIDTNSLQQTFDTNNNLTCKKDEESRVTLYSYNTTNQKLSMTEGLSGSDCNVCLSNPANCNAGGVGRVTTYDYLSPTLDLPRFIRRPSVYVGATFETELVYSDVSHPNLPTQIIQRGFTPSNASVSRTVTLGYTASGQVNSINGPRTDVSDITTLEYYVCTTGGSCGQLKKVINALGHITTYDLYDPNGRLLQMTDPNGLRTNYTYDPRGRVKTITQTPLSGSAALTQYSYTPWGDVSQVVDPDGVVLSYQYDAAQDLRY